MAWPEETQVRRVRELEDGTVGWHVLWDGQSYLGKAVGPAGADAAWVAAAVQRFARKVGSVAVVRGRLYSRVDLLAEVGDT